MKIMNYTTLLILFVALASLQRLEGADLIVSKKGNIKTLTKAIQLAHDGDRIILKKGIYREGNIKINKSVQILGEDYPEIDGENKYEVLTVTADNVRIQGLVIKNAGISYIEDNAGIKIDGGSNCVIEGNKLINNFFGIYLAKSRNSRIANNEIRAMARREANSGNGIHLWYCKNILIENNHISGQRDGIYFEFVEDSNIANNVSENNLRYGLHFMFSHRGRYYNNTFRHNGAGVAVMYTQNVEMHGNRFEKNWGSASFGLLLKEITDSKINHNLFIENSIGYYTDGSNRVKVERNTFVRNGWAAKVLANSTDNVFSNNNFFDNTFEVATNSRQNFNTFKGNYWSHYKGFDLDRDGVGDVPYRPVRLFSLIIAKQPPALILLRSLFIDLLDMAEQIIPALTPETLVDRQPMMKPIQMMNSDHTEGSTGEKYND